MILVREEFKRQLLVELSAYESVRLESLTLWLIKIKIKTNFSFNFHVWLCPSLQFICILCCRFEREKKTINTLNLAYIQEQVSVNISQVQDVV